MTLSSGENRIQKEQDRRYDTETNYFLLLLFTAPVQGGVRKSCISCNKKCAKKLCTIIYIRKIPTYNSMWRNMSSSSPYIHILGPAKICTFTIRVCLGVGLIPCGSRMLLDTTSIIHRRVSIFIATQDAWRSKSVILYLYKYPDPFINIYICPVTCHLIVSRFFGYVIEFDSHNKF